MSESGQIRELDAQTVERIAAGEVVERPASAVKELVENSIDADASRVTVAVEAGGTESIRVTDDGYGMSEDALARAVEKHTTSKISDIDDLEGGVGTLGFRGEALHAIGAVSRLTVTSCPRGGARGTRLTVEGGEITDISPAGCPEGTTVEIRDLFYNVPARRKYLKQESTEFAHVNTVVTSYALANPDVAVTLEHNGRETFATTGQGDLRGTILSVYGREVAEAMIPVEDIELPDGPLVEVTGLVSHPETNRASREYLSTFVNGRYVTATTVRDAVGEAYGSQLAADRHPFAVLFLTVDPATVDVNVHPRKLEVRFANEEGVREQVQAAVEQALLSDGLVRSSAPRGRSAAEQTEIDPARDDSADEDAPLSPSEPAKESGEQAEGTSVDAGPSSEQSDAFAGSGTVERDETDERQMGSPSQSSTASTDQSANSTENSSPSIDQSITSPEQSAQSSGSAKSGESPQPSDNQSEDSIRQPAEESGGSTADSDRKFRAGHEQARLGSGAAGVAFDRLPSMRVLGQFRETYIVAESDDGLVLIDQHAADERINYERLRESFHGETTTQALAEPVRLEVTAQEVELFDASIDALARLGFQARRVDDRTIEVTTVPTLIADGAGPELLRDVLSAFSSGEAAAADTVEAAADALLADLACYPSITGNTSLTEGSVVDLLSALDDCENPYACPHGRPVIVELDDAELEARFERDYPGH